MNLYVRVAKLVNGKGFSEALTKEWEVVRGCSYDKVIAQANRFLHYYLVIRLIKALWLAFFLVLGGFAFFHHPGYDWLAWSLLALLILSFSAGVLTIIFVFFSTRNQEDFVDFTKGVEELAALLCWSVEDLAVVSKASHPELRRRSEQLLRELKLVLNIAIEEEARDREDEDSDIDPVVSLESARWDYREAREILGRFGLCPITSINFRRPRVGVA